MAKYDLAISFAGEQRDLALELAERLDSSGYSIFYDAFEQAELWGRDLTLSLADVYENEARFCLVIVSKEYVEKAWTNLERQHAITRLMTRRGDYILCLRTDGTALPGLPGTVGYLSLSDLDLDEAHRLLLRKIGNPDHDDRVSRLSPNDQSVAREVIRTCYRRSIYTRMAAEIDLPAMYSSIESAIGSVQRHIPSFESQEAQQVAASIVKHLDAIDRYKVSSSATMSHHLDPADANAIDDHKMQILRLVLELRRAGSLALQLPFSLAHYHFYRQEEADREPDLHAA